MKTEKMITLGEVFDIVRRRRWAILIPIFITIIAGMYVSLTTPKIYKASTLVIVQPQKVPEDYVRSVVTDDAESRLSTISQQIMSRANLEKIINEFSLMPTQGNVYIEDVIEGLKANIKVRVSRDRRGADTFSITYKGGNPEKVMQIANALTNYFITSSSTEREFQAAGTNEFLEDELKNVQKRLLQMEGELKEYRQQFMGELPEQLNSNLARLQGIQNQLTSKEAALRDIKLRLSDVESQSASQEGALNPYDMEALERQLGELLMRYTENHPDVLRLKGRIAEMQKGQPNQGGIYVSGSSSKLARKKAELTRDRITLESQIANLQSEIYMYQRRVEETPKREQELISLRRDYDNMSNLYSSLLKRKLESEISVNMEKKQKGEQFQVIDHAQVPIRPFEPDLERIFLMTVAIGLGLGFGLAYLLEFIDTTYRKPEKIETDFKLPVIAAIPVSYRPKSSILKERFEAVACSMFAFLTLALIGTFSYMTWFGMDKALEYYKDYINL